MFLASVSHLSELGWTHGNEDLSLPCNPDLKRMALYKLALLFSLAKPDFISPKFYLPDMSISIPLWYPASFLVHALLTEWLNKIIVTPPPHSMIGRESKSSNMQNVCFTTDPKPDHVGWQVNS